MRCSSKQKSVLAVCIVVFVTSLWWGVPRVARWMTRSPAASPKETTSTSLSATTRLGRDKVIGNRDLKPFKRSSGPGDQDRPHSVSSEKEWREWSTWRDSKEGVDTLTQLQALDMIAESRGDLTVDDCITLAGLLEHPQKRVRLLSVISMGRATSEEARELLRPLVSDLLSNSSSDVRAVAAATLGDIGNEKTIQQLSSLLGDSDPSVAGIARICIDKLAQKAK